jgi:formyl-CoA transferase
VVGGDEPAEAAAQPRIPGIPGVVGGDEPADVAAQPRIPGIPAIPGIPGVVALTMGALDGVRVLELTQIMAGPFCGQVLADMGADVVKVEPPGTGDQTRRQMGEAAFRAVNRNKRSITLDLKDPADVETLHGLAKAADVVMENYRPGVAERLGADWDTLHGLNPRLIYASISGFGQTGPYAQRPGFDLIAQAASGIMSVTGEPDGNPVKCGVPVSDLSAGLFCAVGILSALHARERTGVGQRIDTSLFEGAFALSIWETAQLWSTGETPQPLGSAHRISAPYQALRTRDGHLVVGGNNQKLWERLCGVLERPELFADPRFADNAARMAHRPELVAELESALAARDTDTWVSALLEAGVPAGPIHDYAQAVADPHTRARDMVVEMEHPEAGTVRGIGIPVKLSATPGSIRRPAPLLGQHDEEVRGEWLT